MQGRAGATAPPRSEKLLDQASVIAAVCRFDEKPVLTGESSMSILAELWRFMRVRKKYWLAPIVLLLVIFGGLILMVQGSAVAPFIYTLF